jgi:hypothetical protein
VLTGLLSRPSQALKEYILFVFPKTDELRDAPSFPLAFNIMDLKQIGGFDIVLTGSLQEHLSIVVGHARKKLKIFHLSSFLRSYRYSHDRYASGLASLLFHFCQRYLVELSDKLSCSKRNLPCRLYRRDIPNTLSPLPSLRSRMSMMGT